MIDRLVEIREASGQMQVEFAEMMGVSVATQRSYEKGVSNPSSDYLIRLHNLGYDVVYLLTGQRNINILSQEDSELLAIWHKAPLLLRNAALNVLLNQQAMPQQSIQQQNNGGYNNLINGGNPHIEHHHGNDKSGNSIGNITGSYIGGISQKLDDE